MDKKTFRLKIKEELALIDKSELSKMSLQISRNLQSLFPEFISNALKTKILIGVYSPIQKEPVWFDEVKGPVQVEFAMVNMESQDRINFFRMELSKIKNGCDLRLSLGNKVNEVIPDIILIPGLGFTKEFERIGRGKGCYDRYLENFEGKKIGVCFEQQIKSNVFATKQDIKMDMIITEKCIYKRGI
jgi:5-formyltetrahydrofolate cyclo-ligase